MSHYAIYNNTLRVLETRNSKKSTSKTIYFSI